MGTRSITYIVDGEKPIAAMYRQYDGYLDGHGKELAEFLDDHVIVNGFSPGNSQQFNGIGDLGARLFTHLKKDASEVGGYYLTDPSTGETQEYNYFVSIENDAVLVKVFKENFADSRLGELLFKGTPAELLEHIKSEVA